MISRVPKAPQSKNPCGFVRFLRERSGATAIEFGILALPFLLVVFATFETFVAFTAEQVVANATDTFSRQLRTGQITFGLGKATDMTEVEFREAFCSEIALLIQCSASEAATPAKLYIDLHQVDTFGDIVTSIPRIGSESTSDLDTSAFSFSPGGAGEINSFRVYYRWSVMTDIVRPLISNLTPDGETTPSEFLIVATSAFRNEDYP